MKKLIRPLLFSIIAAAFLVEAGRCCWYHGRLLSPGVHTINCVQVTCYRNGTIDTLGCPLIKIRCINGTHIEIQPQNNSQPYNACCSRPFCVKDK